MTIAIGVLAQDGIVVAADTQVGITDYLKMSFGKIAFGRRTGSVSSGFAVTGAGNSAYLEAVRQIEVESFLDLDAAFDMEDLESRMGERIEDFYSRHVVPFSSYPSNERPDFSLLMAAVNGDARRLWYTEKNLLIPCSQYAAVGIGTMYAKILLHKLYSLTDIKAAILLAAYVIHHVKENIDGCGQETTIVYLHKDTTWYLELDLAAKLDEAFREQWLREAEAVQFLFSKQDGDLEAHSQALKRTRENCQELLNKLIIS